VEDLISNIVDRIIEDLSDRRGLRQEWDMIDPEIQQNIRAAWTSIVREEVRLYNASDE
jgi:hypothetical protein